MSRNPRYDILFEPVQIGPVTAPNRFYQVPHASGMTNANPRMRAAFRGVKAEGGWGVVCSGYCSIHSSADDSPLPYGALWEDSDIAAHRLATDAIHEHGSLAGVELWHGGSTIPNRTTRTPPLSPSGIDWMSNHISSKCNLQSRAMDKADIKAFLGWQKAAAERSVKAGYDIVYVYAGMGYLPQQFLLSEYNVRTDEYGGNIRDRCRLVQEMLEVTREGVGDKAAVAIRISMQEFHSRAGDVLETQGHDIVEVLDPYLDLWDVKMDHSTSDCAPSRFSQEGSHETTISFVKTIAKKPVVGVGRFTTPDTMISQIKSGVLDLIGSARPSIADPFLPNKIRDGQEDDIRECIGCNMCIANWRDCVPIRCTQNPSIGEEWRQGWHPEVIRTKHSNEKVLIVGAGPSGLEAARALGTRGYQVILADKNNELGGRVLFESALPGLSAWRRVIDYRIGQLQKMPNVELYPASELSLENILEFGFEHVSVATGSEWTKNLYSDMEYAIPPSQEMVALTPSDIANGAKTSGKVVVFDFDGYYMGSSLAEKLQREGSEVSLVTPYAHVGHWSHHTNENIHTYRRLHELGIPVYPLKLVKEFSDRNLKIKHMYNPIHDELVCDHLVIVGRRHSNDKLFNELMNKRETWHINGIKTVQVIGDASAPGLILHATYSGRDYAENFDRNPNQLAFKRDYPLEAEVA